VSDHSSEPRGSDLLKSAATSQARADTTQDVVPRLAESSLSVGARRDDYDEYKSILGSIYLNLIILDAWRCVFIDFVVQNGGPFNAELTSDLQGKIIFLDVSNCLGLIGLKQCTNDLIEPLFCSVFHTLSSFTAQHGDA